MHFAKEYLHKKDYKKLAKHFSDADVDEDTLVKKTGGIRGLLECYFKHNPEEKKKTTKKREIKAAYKKKAEGVTTRSRASSLDWKPTEQQMPAVTEVKEVKFQRIDQDKFRGLQAGDADYSYEAK